MDRIETYVGQSIFEWAFSKPGQNTMVGLGKMISAMFGSTTVANGLACTQQSVPTMFVNIAAGEIYQAAQLEATACGTLPADTAHTIMKQGIALDTVVVPNAATGVTAFTAPGTSGQSINYLVQAAYADADVSVDPTTGASPVVLPFYNSATPGTPYQGPNGSGATSNTFRKGIVSLQVKAGTAATTGSQATPTPDAGYVGLWVVTVAFAQTSIVTANIAAYPGAPILSTSMLASIQSGNLQYGVDVSTTTNVIQGVFTVPPAALVDNQQFWVKIKNTNNGAMTFTPNVGVIAPAPVVGGAHAALQGGEAVANGRALLVWRADITSYVLESCTGGALQVTNASQSQQAISLGQGDARYAQGLQANALNIVTVTGSLAATVAGSTVVVNAAGATTQTLPAASAVTAGKRIEFLNINTGTATVSRAGSDVITTNSTTATSLALGNGDTLTLESDGVSKWYAVGGTAQLKFSNSFGGLLAANGWTRQPNGMILQWGSVSSVTGGGGVTVTFPIAFPSTFYSGSATLSQATTTSGAGAGIFAAGLTTMGVANYSSGAATTVYWDAKGI